MTAPVSKVPLVHYYLGVPFTQLGPAVVVHEHGGHFARGLGGADFSPGMGPFGSHYEQARAMGAVDGELEAVRGAVPVGRRVTFMWTPSTQPTKAGAWGTQLRVRGSRVRARVSSLHGQEEARGVVEGDAVALFGRQHQVVYGLVVHQKGAPCGRHSRHHRFRKAVTPRKRLAT